MIRPPVRPALFRVDADGSEVGLLIRKDELGNTTYVPADPVLHMTRVVEAEPGGIQDGCEAGT